jgi:hypothetical protein
VQQRKHIYVSSFFGFIPRGRSSLSPCHSFVGMRKRCSRFDVYESLEDQRFVVRFVLSFNCILFHDAFDFFRLTYRSLGSTSSSYERSLQHRNYVKILRFLSLVCERSRREETFSLRSNVMMGNTMQTLVDSVSSNIDQQVPMDALNCVRLALECWPRIDIIIQRLKNSHETIANVCVASPQVFEIHPIILHVLTF